MSSAVSESVQTTAQQVAPGILRADGVAPFNSYFWPTESWWLNDHDKSADGRWHFGIVALNTGQFAVSGHIWCIRDNKDIGGRQNNFPDRESAIRASAARLITVMRASRTWNSWHGGLSGERLATAINWVLETVRRETNGTAPRIVTIKPPEPLHAGSGLPLFNFPLRASAPLR